MISEGEKVRAKWGDSFIREGDVGTVEFVGTGVLRVEWENPTYIDAEGRTVWWVVTDQVEKVA